MAPPAATAAAMPIAAIFTKRWGSPDPRSDLLLQSISLTGCLGAYLYWSIGLKIDWFIGILILVYRMFIGILIVSSISILYIKQPTRVLKTAHMICSPLLLMLNFSNIEIVVHMPFPDFWTKKWGWHGLVMFSFSGVKKQALLEPTDPKLPASHKKSHSFHIILPLSLPSKSKNQTLPIGSRESCIWIILKTIFCLVMDIQSLYI